jgi:hypothetical protein
VTSHFFRRVEIRHAADTARGQLRVLFGFSASAAFIAYGLFGWQLLWIFQSANGAARLCGHPSARVYETLTIAVPACCGAATLAMGALLIGYNVMHKRWPRWDLIMIPLYLFEFVLLLYWLAILDFYAFD